MASKLFWLEAVLPLGIIAGMLCIAGNAQYYIYRAANGRPKHIGNDMWDTAMERRDKKIMEMLATKQVQGIHLYDGSWGFWNLGIIETN